MSKKRRKKFSDFLFIFFILLFFFIFYNLYIMYKNIDITTNYNYTSEQTSLSTNYSETVDNQAETNQTITEMLEIVTESVVGISKLTSAGRFYF